MPDGIISLVSKPAKFLSLAGAIALTTCSSYSNAASEPQPGVTAAAPQQTLKQKQQQEPRPFTANYRTRYSGFNAKGTRRLSKEGDEWVLDVSADARVVNITETSRFKIANDTIEPQYYRFHRGGLFGASPEEVTFNWKTMETRWAHEDEPVRFPKGAQDKLSHQFQLSMDLAAGKTDLRYPVVDDDEVFERAFIIEGKELLDTPAGLLNTIRVKIKRDHNKRQTWIWFAEDWDYLLVKFQQKDNSEYLIEFTDGEIAGKTITGLKK